ncbi:MAG: Flp pilus assembly protein CpaB [Marinomonas sp.]|uniref:Flp pilus assembly protein CpaB n=1 Tax=Marinomonas communis TaxID=28254 RepID=UPI000C51B960|nr:Flp pilus assembly protein CpaB [Marinomonas communis]MAF15495.1 Flp pilus assembly protein CpaB [Marinomonas sp.]MCC4275264.1 Flp pilus assembly protein CpaB [Marinomonas communis]
MKSRLLMYLSLIILGVGLIGIYLLKTAEPAPKNDVPLPVAEVAPPPEETVQVWKSKADLSKGQFVSRDNFYIEEVPKSQALLLGVDKDIQLDFMDGMVIKKSTSADQPVFPELLAFPNQEGYFRFALEEGFMPVPVAVRASAVLGDVIQAGSIVDILALASPTENLNNSSVVRDLSNVSLTSVVNGVKVLQVYKKEVDKPKNNGSMVSAILPTGQDINMVTIIMQLTKQQAAKVAMARNISQLEILLSSEKTRRSFINIDSGDLLPEAKPVRELRPGSNTSQNQNMSFLQ